MANDNKMTQVKVVDNAASQDNKKWYDFIVNPFKKAHAWLGEHPVVKTIVDVGIGVGAGFGVKGMIDKAHPNTVYVPVYNVAEEVEEPATEEDVEEVDDDEIEEESEDEEDDEDE